MLVHGMQCARRITQRRVRVLPVNISVVPKSSPLLSTNPTRSGRNVPKSPRDPLTSLRERSFQNSRLVLMTQSMVV